MKNINMTVKNPLGIIALFPSEDAVVIKYVNLGFSNGMKIELHNLSYSGLQNLSLNFKPYV